MRVSLVQRGPSATVPPLFLATGCLRPLASSNGYANISELQTSFPVGTVISYHCFPGYKLEGAEHLECLHSLIWSTSPPRCLALEGNVSTLREGDSQLQRMLLREVTSWEPWSAQLPFLECTRP